MIGEDFAANLQHRSIRRAAERRDEAKYGGRDMANVDALQLQDLVGFDATRHLDGLSQEARQHLQRAQQLSRVLCGIPTTAAKTILSVTREAHSFLSFCPVGAHLENLDAYSRSILSQLKTTVAHALSVVDSEPAEDGIRLLSTVTMCESLPADMREQMVVDIREKQEDMFVQLLRAVDDFKDALHCPQKGERKIRDLWSESLADLNVKRKRKWDLHYSPEKVARLSRELEAKRMKARRRYASTAQDIMSLTLSYLRHAVDMDELLLQDQVQSWLGKLADSLQTIKKPLIEHFGLDRVPCEVSCAVAFCWVFQ